MVLKCSHYKYHTDENKCTGSYEECIKGVDCKSGNDTSHCFVVWEEGGRGVIGAGCNYNYNNTNEVCYSDCIGQPKGKLHYCCCTEDFCNSKFKLPPAMPIKAPENEDPQGNQTAKNNSDLSWSAFPILMMFVVICALVYKHTRRHRRKSSIRRSESGDGAGIRLKDNSHQSTQFHELYEHGDFNRNQNNNINSRGQQTVITMRNQNNTNFINRQVGVETDKIDLSNIELLEVIGSGRFGTVHRAHLDNTTVAVKITSFKDNQSYANELQIYSLPKLRHPNILSFIASDEHLDPEHYCLILEYAPNGSLHNFLKESIVDWDQFLHITLGVVTGLAHLHESDIAHRDFKSKNVLLKHDLTPCITDFGVATILDTTAGSQTSQPKKYLQVGTPRYMAPEVLECSVSFTKSSFTKIDVYALSLVVWELLTRTSPLRIPGQDMVVDYNRDYQLPFEEFVGPQPTIDLMRQVVVVDKIRPPMREEWRSFPALYRAIEDGWEYDHDARISASCFLERVESLRVE